MLKKLRKPGKRPLGLRNVPVPKIPQRGVSMQSISSRKV